MKDRFDLHDSAVIQNPFPLLAEMRRDAPVHWNRSVKGWFLTRYYDVRMVMRDPRFSVEKIAPFAERADPSMQEKIAFRRHRSRGWYLGGRGRGWVRRPGVGGNQSRLGSRAGWFRGRVFALVVTAAATRY